MNAVATASQDVARVPQIVTAKRQRAAAPPESVTDNRRAKGGAVDNRNGERSIPAFLDRRGVTDVVTARRVDHQQTHTYMRPTATACGTLSTAVTGDCK